MVKLYIAKGLRKESKSTCTSRHAHIHTHTQAHTTRAHTNKRTALYHVPMRQAHAALLEEAARRCLARRWDAQDLGAQLMGQDRGGRSAAAFLI